MSSSKAVIKSGTMSSVAKGVLISICVSLVGIFAFALVLKFVNIGDLAIKIVNQVIKILSVFFGVKVALKKDKSRALIKGLVVGVLYTVLSYFIFSLLVATFSFGLNLIYDILFLGIAGVLSGVITAFSKK